MRIAGRRRRTADRQQARRYQDKAVAKLLDLKKRRRMPALIWLQRRAVNRMTIDASHTTLLMVGALESPKEEDEP